MSENIVPCSLASTTSFAFPHSNRDYKDAVRKVDSETLKGKDVLKMLFTLP